MCDLFTDTETLRKKVANVCSTFDRNVRKQCALYRLKPFGVTFKQYQETDTFKSEEDKYRYASKNADDEYLKAVNELSSLKKYVEGIEGKLPKHNEFGNACSSSLVFVSNLEFMLKEQSRLDREKATK